MTYLIYNMTKHAFVVSSGLIEHFKGEKQLACLNAYKHLAKKNGYIVIIAPSDTLFIKRGVAILAT